MKRLLKDTARHHPRLTVALTAVTLLSLWQLLASTGAISLEDWSSPLQVVHVLSTDLVGTEVSYGDQNRSLPLAIHSLKSLSRWAMGFVIAILLGVSFGFVLGNSSTARAVGYPVVNFVRALPSAAIWPVCGVLMGFGMGSQLVVVIFGATWPILINTMDAVRSTPLEAVESLHFMKLEVWRRWLVKLQWAAPGIFTGFEIGGSVAFLLTITVEIFWPAEGGIGWYMAEHAQYREQPELFGGLLLTAFIGWSINTAIHCVQEWAVFWEAASKPSRRHFPRIIPLKIRYRRLVSSLPQSLQRDLLSTHHISGLLKKRFGGDVFVDVLRNQGEPYLFPSDLKRNFPRGATQRLKQRDVIIKARIEGTVKPLLFARSWIDRESLPKGILQDLDGGKVTIGTALASRGVNVEYKYLNIKRTISRNLGRVFAGGGSIEVVVRTRLLSLDGRPSILIKEYFPMIAASA